MTFCNSPSHSNTKNVSELADFSFLPSAISQLIFPLVADQ